MTVPTPNHRRTYLKASDRRSQILDAAKDVFARIGYRIANVADICEAARIGRGTLYQYFQNKRDVLLALIDRICGQIDEALKHRQRVADVPGLAAAPRSMIVAFCTTRLRALLDIVFADEAALRLVLREARGLDGGIDEVVARIDNVVSHAIEEDARVAQEAGLLRDIDLKVAAQFILGGVEKVVLTALASHKPIDLDHIVKQVVEIQLFGLLRVSDRTPDRAR